MSAEQELLDDVLGMQPTVAYGNVISLDDEHAQAVIDAIIELRALRDEKNANTARPYTDAELARDPAAVTASLKAVDVDAELTAARDRTLALKALADLADRVRTLEVRVANLEVGVDDSEPPPYVPPPEPPVGSVVRTANLAKPRWRRADDGWVLDRPGCIELGATWDEICHRYGPVTIEHEGA